ncbi:hypothetical protein A3Q56_00862 [Intoshia linei]|uniref:non-specific serine/threonine protein kinase n=1 Tax=Intoshia linei TaxID=1819745 RepID=A0A177BB01_9BILA|nr:hypothetical protein A3Q56_00862 [Intoshia linei]
MYSDDEDGNNKQRDKPKNEPHKIFSKIFKFSDRNRKSKTPDPNYLQQNHLKPESPSNLERNKSIGFSVYLDEDKMSHDSDSTDDDNNVSNLYSNNYPYQCIDDTFYRDRIDFGPRNENIINRRRTINSTVTDYFGPTAVGPHQVYIDTQQYNISSKSLTFSQSLRSYRPPKIINNYLICGLLGSGTFGTVHECIHIYTLKKCAVKIFDEKRVQRMINGKKNIERELASLEKIKNPYIICLIDVYRVSEKNKLYLFMDHCEIDLHSLIGLCNNESLSEWRTHRYFTQLVEAVEYLHNIYIIHNDIKPSNILITRENCIKLADFGTATIINNMSQNDMISSSEGTPAFQPPEIAQGRVNYNGFKIDIWTLGVTLYYMTTGMLPFNSECVLELYNCIERCDLQIPNYVEKHIADLVVNIMKKNPEDRFTLLQIKRCIWYTTAKNVREDNVCIEKKMEECDSINNFIIHFRQHLNYCKENNIKITHNNMDLGASKINCRTELPDVYDPRLDESLTVTRETSLGNTSTVALSNEIIETQTKRKSIKSDGKSTGSCRILRVRCILDKLTYSQFEEFSEKQYPLDKEKKNQLIKELQDKHYKNYMNKVLEAQNSSDVCLSSICSDEHSESINVEDSNNSDLCSPITLPEKHFAIPKIWYTGDINTFKRELKNSNDRITIACLSYAMISVPTYNKKNTIFWEFASDHYDIGFGLYFEFNDSPPDNIEIYYAESSDNESQTDDDVNSTENESFVNNSRENDKKISEIIPLRRIESHRNIQCGSHEYPSKGTYMFKFDNSYSLFRSKLVYFRVFSTGFRLLEFQVLCNFLGLSKYIKTVNLANNWINEPFSGHIVNLMYKNVNIKVWVMIDKFKKYSFDTESCGKSIWR